MRFAGVTARAAIVDMPVLELQNFTDPACPFAFSAEPARFRLRWLYGDQLAWRTRMVGLSEHPEDYVEKGSTPEKQAASFHKLQQRYGMPIDSREQPRMMATVVACRAVVAARVHAAEHADALLRRLRIHHFAGELIDEPDLIAKAARESGLDPAQLDRWVEDPDVERELRADMAAARAPSAAGRALDHKLAGPDEERRYTCPSYEITRVADGVKVTVPGFHGVEAYEMAVANLAPGLDRRAEPDDVLEVLAWAGEPLATAEVAAVAGLELDDAREQLARVGDLEPVGPDGYWTLPGDIGRLAA
jgi:predicted DsbA family dithiol-disulfide isomerase